MTRKKVKLTYIANDSARKTTYKKRKEGLLKKVHELSTLCDVNACLIMYSPYDSVPEVWPSPLGAQRVLEEFKKMPDIEQCKKMMNQEEFIRQRISRVSQQIKKMQRDNREKEITQLMFDCISVGKGLQSLSITDLNDLNILAERNLKDIHERLENMKNQGGGGGGVETGAGAIAVVGNGVQAVAIATSNPGIAEAVNEVQFGGGEVNLENMQREQRSMEAMNFHVPGQDVMLPFMDNNPQTNFWSSGFNGFFP